MGKYKYADVQALEASFVAPEEGGSPYVRVKLKVVRSKDMPHRVGEEVSEIFSMSDKAAEYSMKALRALGWSCNDVTELEGIGEVVAVGGFYMDTYQGRTKERVNVFEKSKPAAAVSGKAKKDFAAKFKKLAATTPKTERGSFNAGLERNELPDEPEPQPVNDDPFADDGGDDDFDF